MRTITMLGILVLQPLSAAGAEGDPLGTAFAPLLGQCWTGEFPGGTARDTHCYRLVEGGRYIEDRHVVTGIPEPYAGVSLYRWDAAEKTIRYHYFASDGGYSEGLAIPVSGGIDFPQENYVGADGKPLTMRSKLRFDPVGGYHGENEKREGETWTLAAKVSYKPSGLAPVTGTIAFDSLRVSQAIVRDAADIDSDVAAFVAITNLGETPDRLLSARCVCAAKVELHKMEKVGEKMSMANDWPFVIPPGSRAEIKPGSALHLMLMGTTVPLKIGSTMPIILQFERAGAVQIDFRIVGNSAQGWLGE